jgi:hypothetical protein
MNSSPKGNGKFPWRAAMDPERVSIYKEWRNYTEKSGVRGGGEGGSKACTNAIGAKFTGEARAAAGWDKMVVVGSRKITAGVREELLSWQQDIEQAMAPLLP